MNTALIKERTSYLTSYITQLIPATGWYFSSEAPSETLIPDSGKWSCVFQYLEQLSKGRKVAFSLKNHGCAGAACYLGFKAPGLGAGGFLADKEKFKKTVELGNAFYENINAMPAEKKYLIMARIQDIGDKEEIEVINLWIEPAMLSGLLTLANYDRKDNDNVIIPFASGCQAAWTIPYKEKSQQYPKAVVGGLDPAVRGYLSRNMLIFALASKRFIEMTDNINGSFLQEPLWSSIIDRRRGPK